MKEKEQLEIRRCSQLFNLPILGNHYPIPFLLKEKPEQQLVHYEKTYFFVHVRRNLIHLIFISPKTDYFTLAQFLPFLFSDFQVILCASELIEKRLRIYSLSENLRDDVEVSQFLHNLTERAIELKASDIHLEEFQIGLKLRFRVHGLMTEYQSDELIPKGFKNKIKLLAKMDIAITRNPQDGHFEYVSNAGDKYDLRVSSIPGIFGEKIVLRILSNSQEKSSFETLNLPKEFIAALYRVAKILQGWVLIAGPTGSGKTTTLYALINELIKRPINIMTIEDPVEFPLENITQVEVNELAGVRFSDSLRSFMRQDPDVIMVGEIRDEETAQLACKAAMTGHLVLSTIHAGSCREIIRRLKSLNVPEGDLALTVQLLATQFLRPEPCECKQNSNCPLCLGSGVKDRKPEVEFFETDQNFKNGLFSLKKTN